MKNEQWLAWKAIQRLTKKGHDKFELPEPTDAQLLEFYDSERIPEYMEQTARWEGDGGNWDQRRQRYKKDLAFLLQAYEQGLISLEDYTRITTKQDYAPDYLRAMRHRVNRWRPFLFAVDHLHRNVYYITDKNGEPIYLTFQDDAWIVLEDF